MHLDDAPAARAWFTEVIEPLADSFDPVNVERYVHLFSEVLEQSENTCNLKPPMNADERRSEHGCFIGVHPRLSAAIIFPSWGANYAP